jgi:branched-chain amino acid transport system substrate-binding protein
MIEVKVVDTGGQPDQAVVGLRELVDSGAFAISGPLSSGESEVIFVQAAQFGIPVITGTANKEGITALGEGWAFRNTATNTDLYGKALPAWAEAYGIKTAVLVYDEAEPFSVAAGKFSIPGVAPKVGIEIVNVDDPITFARGQTDFSTTVQRIKETEADGIILVSAPVEAGLLARELNRQDETRPIMGHSAQISNAFFEQGGEAINDWVLPSIFDANTSEADSVAYIAAISSADTEPPTAPEAANYYDSILMLAQVMQQAGLDGNSSPEEARTAIQSGLLGLVAFDGVAGETSFDGNNDATKTVYVYVVRGGEAVPLE